MLVAVKIASMLFFCMKEIYVLKGIIINSPAINIISGRNIDKYILVFIFIMWIWFSKQR